MTAAALVKALGGKNGMARCPVHDDRTPSLSIADGPDGRLLVHCHAGCGQADVWAALKKRRLFDDGGRQQFQSRKCSSSKSWQNARNSDRQADALEIWRSTNTADRTPVETYLHERAITPPIPPCLRYHANLKHWDTGLFFPAMVAGVQDGDGKFTAIHRTYLLPDGRGKAEVLKPKKLLGSPADGAIRLAPAEKALGLAEGIETALSALQLFEIPVWAALSCSRFASVAIPDEVIEVQIFADNGAPGIEAAAKARDTFTAAGKRVAIRRPPEAFGDWNDALPTWHERPVGDWEF